MKLSETLSPEVLQLSQLLNSFKNESDRRTSAVEYYTYLIRDFLSDHFPDTSREYDENYDEWEIIEELKKNPETEDIYTEFEDYCFEKILKESPTDGPLWLYMDFRKLVRNTWLIHFSDSAYDIYLKGFKYGVDVYSTERLALSTYYSDETRKRAPGYNFAYNVEDTNLKRTAVHGRSRKPKYGSEAVMFIGSGVQAYHHGDEENQVIFLGSSAKNLVYIEFDNNREKRWHVFSKRNRYRPVFSSDDLDDITTWVIKNYDQYSSVLEEEIEYKDFYDDLLMEAYSTMTNPPQRIEVATGSDADKVVRGRKKSDLNTIQAFKNTEKDFQSIRLGAVWQLLISDRYARRIRVPDVKVTMKLKGRNHERAIGRIENGIFYIYWIGTHEEYNKIY
jgi:hypothetical protein